MARQLSAPERTKGSNPSPSSGESGANPTSSERGPAKLWSLFSRVIPCKSSYRIGASRETPDHADDLGYRILYLDTPSRAHALPDGKCAGFSMSIMVSCGKKTTLGLGNVAGEGTWALVHFRPWCRFTMALGSTRLCGRCDDVVDPHGFDPFPTTA